MRLPPTGERLVERNRLDRQQAIEEAAKLPPAERLRQTLELSELVRRLARATGASGESGSSLEEKARLFARPLRLVRRR